MDLIRMSTTDWFNQFEPIQNPYDDQGWNHALYDTNGPSYAAIEAQLKTGEAHVWTLLDCDGKLVISNGWHYVNRMGYFITKQPAAPGVEYEVSDPDDDDISE